MKFHPCLLTSLLSAGLLFATPDAVNAQLTGVDADNFQKIEQPVATKVAITVAGLGLVGVELWWFLLSGKQFKARFKQYMQSSTEQGTAIAEIEDLAVELLSSEPEAYRYCDDIAVKISAAYGGMQMPKGVLSTEGRVSPRFSSPQFSVG